MEIRDALQPDTKNRPEELVNYNSISQKASLQSGSTSALTTVKHLAIVDLINVGSLQTGSMMRTSINAQWRQLRNAIDKLQSELDSTDFPLPTPQMCKFLIVGEDRRIHRHPGVDVLALCRAVWKTVFCRSRQGASTIAMQLVRTILDRRERTLRRKLMEIVLALRLSQHVSKHRLPILYLWVAYYGWRMNNFKQACSRLGINPRSVDEIDAAKLVARLKYPEPRNCSVERIKKIRRRALHLITQANRTSTREYAYNEVQNATIHNSGVTQ